VEDDRIVALAESRMLEDRGYAVRCAGSGEEALAELEARPLPDLVLMDIDLGDGIDGAEAASRALERWDLPILFLTSHSSAEMVEKVRGISRYGYVVKSSGASVILSCVETALELRGKEAKLAERDLILSRAEDAASLGYWFVRPELGAIELSEGARAIIGIEGEVCSMEEFHAHVLPGYADARGKAFAALVERGIPYDITYRIREWEGNGVRTIRSSGRTFKGRALGVIQDVTELRSLFEELRRAEMWRAITLRSIGDGVISTDASGLVVELNPEAERLTGWGSEEARGKPIATIFPIINEETCLPVENPLQKVIETGYVVGIANHTILLSRDGALRSISDSAAPIKGDDGSILGMVLTFRDVTDERIAEKALARNEAAFRTLFDDSPAPMLVIDPGDGTIVEANRAAADFYGWSVEDLRRMNVDRINVLPREQVASAMARAAGARGTDFRFEHRRADGMTVPVLVRSGPVSLGGRTFLFSIVQDRSREALREAEQDIERTRAALTLRDARHRMRNNLNILSSLIRLQSMEAKAAEVRDSLESLQGRVACMAAAFDQLYRDSEPRPISSREYLASLVGAIAGSQSPPGVEARTDLGDCPLEPRLAASLGMILGELLTNAYKHAFAGLPGGSVSIRFAEESGGCLALEVADDGVGIEAAKEACGASASGRGGARIGLALIEGLVEQEGGVLEIKSDRGGTRVACFFSGKGGS
jgi:PAS domain S-box-containing protein